MQFPVLLPFLTTVSSSLLVLGEPDGRPSIPPFGRELRWGSNGTGELSFIDFLPTIINESIATVEETYGYSNLQSFFWNGQPKHAKRHLAVLPKLDATLKYPSVQPGSSQDQLGNLLPVREHSTAITKTALIIAEVTKRVVHRNSFHKRQKRQFDFQLDFLNPFFPQRRVPPAPTPTQNTLPPVCPVPEELPVVSLTNPFDSRGPCAQSRYSDVEQHCNNPVFPNRGEASTIYRRLLEPAYSNGVDSVRLSGSFQSLPGAREVSLKIFDNLQKPSQKFTALIVHFGQFLAHDMATSPQSKTADGAVPQCCGVSLVHPECWPINVPFDDTMSILNRRTCIEYVRSLLGVRPGCTLGPRVQLNQGTHFIDLSLVYGTRKADTDKLREFENGQLKMTRTDSNTEGFDLLMPNPGACPVLQGRACFKSGDNRVNIQHGLTLLHTIWTRNHNRIAAKLVDLNPNWSEDNLFNEARKINIAQFQHIVYNEFLPVVIGQKVAREFGLDPNEPSKYSFNFDPAVSAEFTAAAFRLHSLIPPVLALRNMDNSKAGSKFIRDAWFSPHDLHNRTFFAQCAAGMIGAAADDMDSHVTSEIQQHFLQKASETIGVDLVTIDIQRGRDYGLQPYVKYRKLCGLAVPRTFGELKTMKIFSDEDIIKLRQTYQSVEDIDLYVGGSLEKPAEGALVGPTFGCLIGEQFLQSRVGDRFFYGNQLPLPSAFTKGQIAELKKVSFAQLMCANIADFNMVQPDLFHIPNNSSNVRRNCADYEEMSFEPWLATA